MSSARWRRNELSRIRDLGMVRELSRLAAFEAVGLPTVFALSRDRNVQEFFLDSPTSTIYLDHAKYGRCESRIFMAERERRALETHMDTFKGYTLDYANPSLKNEFDVFGTRLRVSLDLDPLAVSGFSLDVRKLTSNVLTLRDLVAMDVLSVEAAAFLLASLEAGVNVTIVGETGTGKTTLLNALDEALDPRLRRIYIEDAVETKDLLERGYHQMKLRVDPFERGGEAQPHKVGGDHEDTPPVPRHGDTGRDTVRGAQQGVLPGALRWGEGAADVPLVLSRSRRSGGGWSCMASRRRTCSTSGSSSRC